MADVLIDLGEQRGRVPVGAGRPRTGPHRFRATLAALSAVLLLSVGGAAIRPAPAGPVLVPARIGDTMFVEGDRLYLVGAGPELNDPAVPNKIISMYALPAGELLSRTTVAVTGAIFRVTSAGGTVLVSYQVDTVGAEATVALPAGSDRATWRVPARLLGASAAAGLVLLRENSPQVGDLHWYGVDLSTGRTRWSFAQPEQGYTTPVASPDGFPRRLITATTDGNLRIRDTLTGLPAAVRDVADGPRRGVTVWPVGDLVLVGGPDGITAYTLGGLDRRWHSPVDLAGRWIQDCGGAICVFGYRGGVQALDPATGQPRWSADRWTEAEPAGAHLLAGGTRGTARLPLAVVETATGAVRGDFGDWQPAGGVRPDGTVVGLRQRLGGEVVFYALLDPAALSVRLLGTATGVSGDCRATTEVLVCRRIDAGVAIWPLTGVVTER